MSEKQKAIHNAYCDYEVAKASKPSRICSVKPKHKSGIKTRNMSKAMLAQTLASLFQYRRENIKMGKARYDAIRIAKQLCYSENVIEKIKNATSESEITRILHTAREAME